MNLRSGRLAEGHHPAECGTFCGRWALGLPGPCTQRATIGQRVVLQAPRIGTSWPSHAPGRPDLAWCELMDVSCAADVGMETWLVEHRPWR
jgi:hypothetical protein